MKNLLHACSFSFSVSSIYLLMLMLSDDSLPYSIRKAWWRVLDCTSYIFLLSSSDSWFWLLAYSWSVASQLFVRYMAVKKCVGKLCVAVESLVKNNSHSPIFDNLGIMLHGEKNFCTDMAKIIKVVMVFKSINNFAVFSIFLQFSCSVALTSPFFLYYIKCQVS